MGRDCPLIVAMNVVCGHLAVVFPCCLLIPDASKVLHCVDMNLILPLYFHHNADLLD